MTWTLDIVGVAATAPTLNSPASAYLVRGDAGSVLVDCGPGTVLELARRGAIGDLIAVVVTHRHADHALDLGALAFRLQFPIPRESPLPLYFPAESLDFVEVFDDMIGIPTVPALQAPLAQAFDVRGLDLNTPTPIQIAPGLVLTAFAAQHAVPSASLRFEDTTTGAVLAFSSDTSDCVGLRSAADSADLFICEATYLQASVQELEGHGHLTGAGAGAVAAACDVSTLLLSHIANPALASAIRADAADAAGPRVETILARPEMQFTLQPMPIGSTVLGQLPASIPR